jgi:hypothetical protein
VFKKLNKQRRLGDIFDTYKHIIYSGFFAQFGFVGKMRIRWIHVVFFWASIALISANKAKILKGNGVWK